MALLVAERKMAVKFSCGRGCRLYSATARAERKQGNATFFVGVPPP
jgi:hypothetical protein